MGRINGASITLEILQIEVSVNHYLIRPFFLYIIIIEKLIANTTKTIYNRVHLEIEVGRYRKYHRNIVDISPTSIYRHNIGIIIDISVSYRYFRYWFFRYIDIVSVTKYR